jgi:hypothetical protein
MFTVDSPTLTCHCGSADRALKNAVDYLDSIVAEGVDGFRQLDLLRTQQHAPLQVQLLGNDLSGDGRVDAPAGLLAFDIEAELCRTILLAQQTRAGDTCEILVLARSSAFFCSRFIESCSVAKRPNTDTFSGVGSTATCFGNK